MPSLDKFSSFKKSSVPSHPRIQVGGSHAQEAILHKVLQALYPQEVIEWTAKPDLEEIDTYVLFYACPYDVKEEPLLKESIHYAQQLLESHRLKPNVHLLIIFYRDLKVAFPERKLQREKFMSNLITKEILNREMSIDQERIHVTHEFSTHHLQDTLEELIGSRLYFEIRSY